MPSRQHLRSGTRTSPSMLHMPAERPLAVLRRQIVTSPNHLPATPLRTEPVTAQAMIP